MVWPVSSDKWKAPLEVVFVILMAIKVKGPEVLPHFSLVKNGATRPIAKQGPPAITFCTPTYTPELFIILFLFQILKLSAVAGVGERTQIPSKIITPKHALAWPSHVNSIGQSLPLPSATPRPPQILPTLSLQTWVLQSFYTTVYKKDSSQNDQLLLIRMVSVLETVDSEMW